jgi:hypothetical protein
VQGREVGNIPAETGAFLHIGIAKTLIGAPFTDLSGFVTVLDALALFFSQALDFLGCICKGHNVLLVRLLQSKQHARISRVANSAVVTPQAVNHDFGRKRISVPEVLLSLLHH